jgi:UPF0755 protein
MTRFPRATAPGAALILLGSIGLGLAACGAEIPSPRAYGTELGEDVRIVVPAGAHFRQVTDTLVARELIRTPTLFRLYAKFRGEDRRVRAGPYAIPMGSSWDAILNQLVTGQVEMVALTIPEGWTLRQMAPRLAAFTERETEEVLALLLADNAERRWDVPGPGLEGYLFPDTYRFAEGTSLESIVQTMVSRYRSAWTPERRARAEALGMTEREVMALASIVQAEAARFSEMPRISAVFHNRLRIGYLLQADPTVQYALGERRSRLLFRDIDSVADHPYNTYTQRGLPPGPIGAAGDAALEATLWPEDSDFLYFVARPDGTHIFTRSLVEHNRARVEARRQWDQATLEAQRRASGTSP